jgi:predicted DNA-binding transcriptional regulator AlpA
MKPDTKPDLTHQITCTPAQAMAALGIGKTSLYQLLNAGAFESFLLGSQRLIVTASILQWVSNMSHQQRIDRETNNVIY